MVVGIVLGAVLVAALLLLVIAFPPAGAHRWRHATRPLRRVLRPGHYRSW